MDWNPTLKYRFKVFMLHKVVGRMNQYGAIIQMYVLRALHR